MQSDRLASSEADVTCRVASAVSGMLLLLTAQGIVARYPAPTGETCVTLRLDLAAHRYIRAELRATDATDPAEATLLALTNPLYGP